MKYYSRISFFILLPLLGTAQQTVEDSLLSIINKHRGDTVEVNSLAYLGNLQISPDSAIKYAQQGLALAERINYKTGEGDCYHVFSNASFAKGNFSEAIQYDLNALAVFKVAKDSVGMASMYLMLQGTYRDVGDYRKSLSYAFSAAQIAERNNVKGRFVFPGLHLAPLALAEIAQTYILTDQLDSALLYVQKSRTRREPYYNGEWNFPVYLLATIQNMQGDYTNALKNYHSAILLALQNGVQRDVFQTYSGMSTLFKKTGQLDSSIYYARLVVNSSLPDLEIKNRLEAISNLADVYKMTGNKDSAIKYIILSHAFKDSIFTAEKDREIQNLAFNEQLKKQEILSEQVKFKSRLQLYAMGGGLFVLLLIAAILWRNNLQEQKAKNQIEKAYADLKSTQAQLIQSEKMASLGELTAGIAHEIQNPLNFVNNFSEINNELIEEMYGGNDISEIKDIAKDIQQNNEKIAFHGRRADAIVKNMLQHSKTSSGQKEPTDINALCDEYLRLSYHGMTAKDKNFNAKLETNFDSSIGKLNVVPQDIGRVLLNLYNNAFYATSQKLTAHRSQLDVSDAVYIPTVTVLTKKLSDKIELKVSDNGPGIPQNIIDKIFQPFFTTKPTGQGTGLGLSLSYDIIKAHGGEIKVETKEGEGSMFAIILPL